MSASILGSLSLGYQLLWGPARRPAAVRLFLDTDADTPVDARHLLATLDELWSEQAPPLLLSVQSRRLLLDLLQHAGPRDPTLEIPHDWLTEPAVALQVEQSRQRDLPLVWRGPAGSHPAPELAPCFRQRLLRLNADEAQLALQTSRQQDEGTQPRPSSASPLQPGQIYDAVPSQLLARHGLDQQGAWALAGWPIADVLRARDGRPVPPDRRSIEQLLAAIDADASLEIIEQILSNEPVLAYRFLQYTNSPELGLRREVESIRQGLMVLGLSPLHAWLQQQLPQASDEADLGPVRMALVMRGHLMDRLLEAGEEQQLRSEVYLCGLLADLAPLLAEPLATVLARLPLSWRVRASLLEGDGPYVAYLAIAAALSSPDTLATRRLCEAHALKLEEVNRALLRTLAAVTARTSHRF